MQGYAALKTLSECPIGICIVTRASAACNATKRSQRGDLHNMFCSQRVLCRHIIK